MTRKSAAAFVVTVLALLALVLVPAALAAKGGNGGGKGGGGKPGGGATGTFSLVLVNDTNRNGLPNYGDSVTFAVSSNVSQPWVQLTCYQGADWVTNQYVGFYPGYPWSQVFALSSWKWTSGAADCNARLFDGSSGTTLATMSFHVYA